MAMRALRITKVHTIVLEMLHCETKALTFEINLPEIS